MNEAQALAKLGSWEVDTGTGEITWSRELFRIVGLDPEADLPSLATLSPYLHPQDSGRVLANIEGATLTGSPYTIDYRIVTAAGEIREVVSNGNPVRDPDGAVVRITGTLQDVTDANATARTLARVNSELRRANELNADVIAMLGHDIRTPIAGVCGYLEMLDGDWESLDETDRRDFVARARAATDRLSAMVDHILALAAVDAGRIEPRPETLGLAETLSSVAQESGLPSVPSVAVDVGAQSTISFDRVHFEQIIGNLLTNAFRYGADPVGLTAGRHEGAVSIAVTDGGEGVPPTQVDTLFDRFARTGPRQTAAGGTGFGLYMASRLAEANGASLSYRPPRDGLPHAFVLTISDP